MAVLTSAALLCAMGTGCRKGKTGEEIFLEPAIGVASFGAGDIDGVPSAEPKDLVVSGVSEVKKVPVNVGDYATEYECRTLKGVGAEMTFSIHSITPNTGLTLDIEEIHQRDDDRLAYTVYVNDQELYNRSYRPISDGANHCFFEVPASTVGSGNSVRVRIVSHTEQETRFRRVWATSDLETLVEQQNIHKPMQVLLMLNEVPSNLDYAYLQSLVERYSSGGMYEIGLCWEIQYMQWGKTTTELYLNNVITASLATGAPLYLGINSWWSGTPSGMDGEGGLWQDVQYQQITYDAKDTAGTGHWKLTTPNEFGNNPWLTMNSDTFNRAREQRIQETVSFLQKRTAELAINGKNLPAIHIYTENEPVYWPINWSYYDFNTYPRGVGDFSPLTIAAAAKDGVTLNPVDGLSEQEAQWMFKNLHTYISSTGKAMAEGCQYNTITVKDGVVTYPTDQLVENAYTHSPLQAIYPNWKQNQRGWENHILDSIHFGGEWATTMSDEDNVSLKSDTRVLDYILAYGSYADINCERAGMPNFEILPQTYAYGLEGVVIYNVNAAGDAQNVKNQANCANDTVAVKHYVADSVYVSDFSQKNAYSQNNTLISLQNYRWDGSAVIPKTTDGGSLTYKITDAAVLDTGLTVTTSGDFADPNARLEVLAGASPSTLKSVGIFNSVQDVRVDIAPEAYGSGDVAYVQVRTFAQGLSTAQLSMVALSKVEISKQESMSGPTDGSAYTREQLRKRHEWIAARADAERLFAKYLERIGGTIDEAYRNAYALYRENRYGECLTALSAAVSEALPASFLVSGYGQLGKYPVYVETGDSVKVTVCLLEASDETVRFTLSAGENTDVKVSLLTQKGKYGLTQQDDGSWVIAPGGDQKPVDGKVTFSVSLTAQASVVYPSNFEARVRSANSTQLAVQSQDVRVSGYANSTKFTYAPDVEVYRGADGTAQAALQKCSATDLRYGDYIQVTLDDQQRIRTIYAWYGTVTGEVTAVQETSVVGTLSNPFITVRAANGKTYTFEVGSECELLFPGATGENSKLAIVGNLGLKVGATVTVQYSPYTVNERVRALKIS